MSPKILFLDDSMERCKKFLSAHPMADIVHTADAAMYALNNWGREGEKSYIKNWDLVCLDHDLDDDFDKAGHHNTGYTVAQYIHNQFVMSDYVLKIEHIIVHSLNVPAAERMVRLLQHGWFHT